MSALRQFLILLSGPIVWGVHFNLIYGIAGFGGTFGLSPFTTLLSFWIATLVAVASVGTQYWLLSDKPTWLADIGRSLALLSLVAILLQAVVLLILQ